MQGSRRLLSVIYRPRVFAYLLAVLMLTQLDDKNAYLHVWIAALLIYPHLLQYLLLRLSPSVQVVSLGMMVDGLLVGVLTSLVGFHLEAAVVLMALISISVLIVGGVGLMLAVIPFFGAGALAGGYLHPVAFEGGSSFYFISYACLLAYVMTMGALVFGETRRLNVVNKQELSLRSSLEQFKAVLSPFLPPQLIERPAEAANCQRRKILTVFFSDIEGFTALMDAADEAMVAQLLNRYFGAMTGIAGRHGGTVDKFIGDGVMIFFGDVSSRGVVEDACSCVAMAVEMQAEFGRLSRQWQEESGTGPLHLRIGIHTGYCLVGDFGCDSRKDYTALGSVVNLASRLERCAGQDEILISEDTCRLVEARVRVSARGEHRLKGLSRQVSVYAVEGLMPVTIPSAPV